VINGNPEDIVHITWEREVNLDLPWYPCGGVAVWWKRKMV